MYACSKAVHTYVCMYVLMLQSCTEIDRGISLIEQYTTVGKYVVKQDVSTRSHFQLLSQLTKSFGSKYPEYVLYVSCVLLKTSNPIINTYIVTKNTCTHTNMQC